MIEITLTHALIFYSVLIAAGAVGIWLYTELRTQYAYRVLEKQHLWRCIFCAYVYLDEEARGLSRCPRCESLNAVDDKGARYVRTSDTRDPVEHHEHDSAERRRRNPSRGRRPSGKARGGRRRR